jgi:hypothetical protein
MPLEWRLLQKFGPASRKARYHFWYPHFVIFLADVKIDVNLNCGSEGFEEGEEEGGEEEILASMIRDELHLKNEVTTNGIVMEIFWAWR